MDTAASIEMRRGAFRCVDQRRTKPVTDTGTEMKREIDGEKRKRARGRERLAVARLCSRDNVALSVLSLT